MGIRPIFVLGSPRSGTTMIGNYIGSARSVLNAGEYRALYVAYGALPIQLAEPFSGLVPEDWEPHRLKYMEEVQRHAAEFIVRVAEEQGCSAFCDSSPRNLLILPALLDAFPDAMFVLTLRHYTGTIQSLLRIGTITLLPGNERPIDWVDPTAVAAGMLWSRHYEAAMQLPGERTIPFSYDRFCANPEPTLARFKVRLSATGFPIGELDEAVFETSHASAPGKPRPTVGSRHDSFQLSSIPSFDAPTWSAATEADVRPVVALADALLSAVFPDDYFAPVGYPGSEALLAASVGVRSPNRRAGAAKARGAVPAVSRSDLAAPKARRPRPERKPGPGSGRSSRGRPAKGR